MKKILLLLALGVSLYSNAQLTVFDNGKVQIGHNSPECHVGYGTLDVSGLPNGSNDPNEETGRITFGRLHGAYITGYGTQGFLNLYAGKKMQLGSSENVNALIINGIQYQTTSLYPISAPSFFTSSDARIKENVKTIEDFSKKLHDVNPVSYNLNLKNSTDSSLKTANIHGDQSSSIDDRLHFGFIAQEIQKIYPNLVVEDEDGMLAIDYIGFIPLLVEAYKNMADKVKEQEEMINYFVTKISPSHMPASVNGIEEQKAVLKQNKPNPFSVSTSIECYVPRSVAAAFLCIYDLQGKQILRMDISERGSIVNTVDASRLAPGMYIYSLITDGVEIDSKRMIITD